MDAEVADEIICARYGLVPWWRQLRRIGSGTSFNGEILARHGVVLVTTNYRLGIFGFFAHPELTKSLAPCLRQLWADGSDSGLALGAAEHRKVRRQSRQCNNLRRIGRLADVNALTASPLTKGLFVWAIAQSGPISDQTTLADAEKRDVEWAATLGITGDQTLAKLREIPDTELMGKLGQGGKECRDPE